MKYEVIQTGKTAKVLPIIEYGDDRGFHIGHGTLMHLIRRGMYWHKIENNGAETQLFGEYGSRGAAMVQDTLPGTHVESFSTIPAYGQMAA